jgi:indole-3-glycerol phosphate synthase
VTVLDEIIAHKRTEVAAHRAAVPLAELERRAAEAPPARAFAAAITGPPVRVIAEVKRASPSRGAIRPEADPVALARVYEVAGAAAVSVLTDRRYFQGSEEDLRAVRAAIHIPVLRKDFIVDPYQVCESRSVGADAVLLIAGTVPREDLALLGELAAEQGMTPLFEVHTAADVDEVLAAGAGVVGINNRDLRTLAIDLDVTARLRPLIPRGIVVVSESGIETPADVVRLRRAGIDAILVGTALMGSPDPAARLGALRRAAEAEESRLSGGSP